MAHLVAELGFDAESFAMAVGPFFELLGTGNFLELDVDFAGQEGEVYSDYYRLTAASGGDTAEITFAGDLTEPEPDNVEGTIRYIEPTFAGEVVVLWISDFEIDFDQALQLLFSDPEVPHPLFVDIFSGDDLIELSHQGDLFDGLDGDDTMFGGDGADTLFGGDGSDVLFTGGNTGAGVDEMSGGEGEDVFYAHSGRESFDGGDGIDTVSFAEVEDDGGAGGESFGVVVSLAAGVEHEVRLGHAVDFNAIENLVGSTGNDVLTGDSLANAIFGGEGTDTLEGGGGEDLLNGGDGFDTARFELARADLAITALENGLHAVSAEGAVTLTEIEKIQLTDGALLYDIDSENLSFAYRIYAAAYGRTPDEDGLRFWADVLDDRGDGPPDVDDKEFIASFFLTADEFVSKYGEDPTNEEYINKLYQNVLHREADQAGYDFWLGVIAGGQGKDDLLIWFTDSDENLENTAPDLDDGIWVL